MIKNIPQQGLQELAPLGEGRFAPLTLGGASLLDGDIDIRGVARCYWGTQRPTISGTSRIYTTIVRLHRLVSHHAQHSPIKSRTDISGQ